MDTSKLTYSSFPLEWTIRSTSYQIQYRKAFSINEIDEIFCSIIEAKGNGINVADLGSVLGFNLQDWAEADILKIYLKSIAEFNLITVSQETIHLTEIGREALQSKLKYKYFFASTELFENQTVTGEGFDFSFKKTFGIENGIIQEKEITKKTLDHPEKKEKLQFQLFENDIFRGEIIKMYESNSFISYKNISLQCEIFEHENFFETTIYQSAVNKPDIQFLIDLPENEDFKSKLIRKGMYHKILSDNNSITGQIIEEYIDLWNWRELARNPNLNWDDITIFNLFLKNGDGSIWSILSEMVPINIIKSVLQDYEDYWNWTTLTERFDDDFIKEKVANFNWDFEELSYKGTELVTSLLSNLNLKDKDWDWNYLSKNLPDKFIEQHIEDFSWDFYTITVNKNEVFKNTFIRYRDKLETAISKDWNWEFVSQEINVKFLYKNLLDLASKLDWNTVLDRLFNDEEIIEKFLKDESLKSVIKNYLPDNFVIAHQKYIWTLDLIDFFEEQNLIQWETKAYIQGFDTNENVEWNKLVFEKYYKHITSNNGFLNISQRITEYSLIEEIPDFAWNWEGISKNQHLIDNTTFIEKAFVGNFSFSNNLFWHEILSRSNFDISFWNENLKKFYETSDSEKQIQFWKSLTQKEKKEYILANNHLSWDWTYFTENIDEEIILNSFNDVNLFEKWDWKIATRKLQKETILDNLEDLAHLIDWEFLIKEVFTVESELTMDKQLPRIAACLSIIQPEIRKNIWRNLTKKFPFELLFPIAEATNNLTVFEWDWDFISNHKFFPTDFATLTKFKKKINWSILSESNAIQQKYNPRNWNDGKEWFNNIDRYLKRFADKWDWQVLSQNRNINYNRLLLQKYKSENWNWDYLTEFGGFLTRQKKDNEKYLEQVARQFPKIKFEILSKRNDIIVDSDFILSTKDKSWDWRILSENDNIDITNELLLELKNKNWNWRAISKRKNIKFTNDTLLQSLEKDWDWFYLSENGNLEFDLEFIEKTIDKDWNWKAVSRHKTFLPTIELLSLTKDFDLDWAHLSQNSSLNPGKELLAKFENKWHWQIITENPQIDFSDIDFIERFADKWNWRFICKSGQLALNKEILTQFKDHLDWDLISSNTNVHFTIEIIQDFKQFWNWTALKENKRVKELVGNYVSNEIEKSAILDFIDRIEQQPSPWKGSIYHFSHIENAVEIIKNRKIQSRNTATIKGDAAGNVVHRRDDAHNYARFYFRPHTPTQFYNEFLGKNSTDGYKNKNQGWVSWYEKARVLGFPKCPIPIFFKFSLKEVLFKNDKQCCISNGNMQTGSTQFGSLEKMINKFGFEDLYYTPPQYATKEDYTRYRNYAQQEFLVKDELRFNDMINFEIVCPSEKDRTLLINLLGQEHREIFSKILVNRNYYNNENPKVRVEEEESELHISTNFEGSGYFVLHCSSSIQEIEILSGDVNRLHKDKIVFNSYISIGNLKQNIRLNFIDESGRNWFVYAN